MPIITPVVTQDLTDVETSPRHQTGMIVHGTDGGVYEYVYAGAAITQYDAVVINGCGTARPATTALAVSMKKIGVAQIAFACGEYGFVARQGYGLTCNLVANAGATAQLYTTATAGALGTTLVTAALVAGALSVTAASAGGTTAATVSFGTPAVTIAAAPGS